VTSPRFGHERARRFSHALAKLPAARTAELLPLLAACRPADDRGGIAIDLGAGSGFLSVVLEQLYDRVVRVDSSAPMLSTTTRAEDETIVADLTEAALPADVGAPDLVVSLATLHHICVTAGDVIDPVASRHRQERTVRAWVDRLVAGGRFMVVDVGAPAAATDAHLEKTVRRLAEHGMAPVPWAMLDQLDTGPTCGYRFAATAELLGLDRSGTGLALPDLIDRYRGLGLGIDPLGPIRYFDDVVATWSLDGHDAHFLDESALASMLRAAGLKDVAAGVLPTPWFFPSFEAAYWFVNELFGLEFTAPDDPADWDRATMAKVERTIDRRLRIRPLLGRTVVEWQLAYAIGVKR
jgi:SAM-dependent methyltransferase